ncbi:MAG: hypothetical protein ACOYXC_07625 [Candidatus Rifleibacteriota bacterium]
MKTGFKASGLILAMVLTALALFSSSASSQQKSDQQMCFDNQRVILQAVETYNHAYPGTITTINHEDVVETGFLRQSGYLKENLNISAACRYQTEGNLCATGTIFCDVHGHP